MLECCLLSRWDRWLCVGLLCVVTGCGGGAVESPQPPPVNAATPATESADPVAVPSVPSRTVESPEPAGLAMGQPNPQTRRPDEVWEDEDGRRYLGRVPYDVFFDHPLTVAAETRPGDSASTAAVTAESPADNPTVSPSAAEPEPAGGVADSSTETGWTALLPVEVLESEVKATRNFLNQKLQSVGTYNSAVTMIPVKAATLAALAAIAMQHSEDLSWKQDAAYIRDLAASMNDSTLQRGPKDQRRLLAIFENLADTLNRSRPADLVAPDPDTSLSDVAEMRLLMMRMEQAEQRLRSEISESSFASDRDIVLHESTILAALMRAMTTESYGYADDPDFTGLAMKVIESGQSMKEAAEAGQFEDFELSLSQIAGTCQACHRDYKNN